MLGTSIGCEKSTRSAGVLVMCDKCFAVGGFARILVASDDCSTVVTFARVLVAGKYCLAVIAFARILVDGKYCLAVIAFARILVASKNCNAVLFNVPDRRKCPGSFHNSDCRCKDQRYDERGAVSHGLAFNGFPLGSWVALRAVAN